MYEEPTCLKGQLLNPNGFINVSRNLNAVFKTGQLPLHIQINVNLQMYLFLLQTVFKTR